MSRTGPCTVPYGILVVGRDDTCGALWCGNVAGGAVPVPYRYCRYGIGADFGTLWVGISNASGTGAGAVTVLVVGGSGWDILVRCGEVHRC